MEGSRVDKPWWKCRKCRRGAIGDSSAQVDASWLEVVEFAAGDFRPPRHVGRLRAFQGRQSAPSLHVCLLRARQST